MIEISEATKNLFRSDSVHKELTITFPDISTVFTNDDIVGESFSLTESIQSGDDLDFIGCCASVCQVEIANTALELVGQKMIVSIKADGSNESIPLFYGFVDSAAKQDAYSVTRKIVAYDPLAKILQQDCTDWYLGLDFPMRVLDFRNAFWEYIGYDQEDIKLINDFIWLNQGLDGKSKISGKTIVESICEFNACYGLFNRNGVFTYQYLNDIYEGLYPADDLYPDDDLHPSSENPDSEAYDITRLLSVKYEGYTTKCIDHVYITDKDGSVVGEYGTGSNMYIVANNFLSFGITQSEAQEAAQKIYFKIFEIDYVPCEVEVVSAPWVECSDVLVFIGPTDILRSYILSRTITGIQFLKDSFDIPGSEYRSTNLDSAETKLNTLSSSIETETSRASAAEKTLTDNLGREINNRVEAVNGCYSQITQTATQIRTEVVAGDNSVRSELNQKANSIEASVRSVSGSVASLELKVNDQGGSIANLSADVVNLNGNVTNINSNITNINSDIVNMNNAIANKVTASQVDTKISNAWSSGVLNSLSVVGDLYFRGYKVRIKNDGTLYVDM